MRDFFNLREGFPNLSFIKRSFVLAAVGAIGITIGALVIYLIF